MEVRRSMLEAVQLHKAGRLAEAAQLYRQIIAVEPKNVDAHNNLGEILRQANDLPAAIECYRNALRINPNFAPVHANLALALVSTGDIENAIEELNTAIHLKPDLAEAHQHLGNIFRERGDHQAALTAFMKAVTINPRYAKALYRAGLSLLELQRYTDAAAAFGRAVTIEPNLADAHFQAGFALQRLGRDDLAADAWAKTLQIVPTALGAGINLADIRTRQGRLTEAADLLRNAIAANPDAWAAYNNLGNVLLDSGNVDESIKMYREGLRRKPDEHVAHSNMLFALNHHPAYDREKLFEEHLEWSRLHADHLIPASPTFPNTRDPDRVLRVGYVSPDYRATSVAIFLRAIFTHHDRAKVHFKCYADVRLRDSVTEELKKLAHEWQDTQHLSHEQFAQQVRADRIDILIDLTVHAGWHRLLAFARRPAPVQMTYLGYPNTTGVSAVDYRITDVHIDPPGISETYYAEKLLRLPETYFCYRAPESPTVGPLPFLKNGFITFGSFNRLSKLSDPALELWAKVLNTLPDSRLLMQAQGLADEFTREQIIQRFARHGISSDRLEMIGWTGTQIYLATMNRVDISLDTFPFTGGTTTLHLMWMGVPTITLAWDSPVGRMGVSIARNAGLPELSAETGEEYVSNAVDLAKNVTRLEELRRTMRERLQASPLMDEKPFVNNLEDAYRTAWKDWITSTDEHR